MASPPVDSPPAPQAAPEGFAQAEAQAAGASPFAAVAGARACGACGAAMAAGQDWCLGCGAGAPGSLGESAWRPAAGVLATVLVLVLGAGAAAYAALGKGAAAPRVLTRTIAQASTPASGGATGTPASALPRTPGPAATTPKAASAPLGLGGAKPPKIPLTAITPKASEKSAASANGSGEGATGATKTTPASTTPSSSTTGGSSEKSEAGESSEEAQSAIPLDTDAAKTYDPYGYPASWFGDPSLAIDGDPSTAWTAQVNPATAPKMAEGLLIDLKSKQKVAVAQLLTSTPGMTVQVYGTDSRTAPTSITAPEWVPLSAAELVKKRKLRLPLRDSSKSCRFLVLWISSAPQTAVGTPEAPGHVSVDELELFPPPAG